MKEYPGGARVGPISIEVPEGEIYGLVGPNGAGKTTILKLITGLLRPTRGALLVREFDPSTDSIPVKEIVGYLPEEASLYETMTVDSYLRFFADLYLVDKGTASRRISHSYQLLDLSGESVIGDLSKGTKRKVAIARSLINDPQLLVYDEPTAGLDVMTAAAIIEYIKGLRDTGKSVIFSAHDMSLVEKACDRVGVILGGKIVDQGTVGELVSRHGERLIEVSYVLNGGKVPANFSTTRKSDSEYSTLLENMDEVNQLTEYLAKSGGKMTNLNNRSSSLLEIFERLVKNETGN